MNRTILSYSICTIGALLLLCYLTSCNTPQRSYKRGYKKISKGHVISPLASAAFCAANYPVISKKDSVLIYKPGVPYYIRDTTVIDCDTVTVVDGRRIVKMPCKPCKQQTDTLLIYTTYTVVNTAEIKAANIERDNYKAQYEKSKNKARGNFVWACSVSGLLLLIIVVWILKEVYWNKATKLVP